MNGENEAVSHLRKNPFISFYHAMPQNKSRGTKKIFVFVLNSGHTKPDGNFKVVYKIQPKEKEKQ